MTTSTVLSSLALARIILLTLVRCLGAFWFAPCFGNGEVSRFWRLALGLVTATLIFPALIAHNPPLYDVDLAISFSAFLSLLVELILEALLGALVGLTLKCYFCALHLAGELVSRVGGISVVGAFDSSLGEEASVLSRFYTFSAFLLFALCGGFELFMDGFMRLCVETPPGSAMDVQRLVPVFVATLSSACVLALKISVPVVVTTGLLYLGIGFAGRVTPQINLTSTSFNIGSLLTLSALSLTFGVSCLLFKEEILRFVEELLATL